MTNFESWMIFLNFDFSFKCTLKVFFLKTRLQTQNTKQMKSKNGWIKNLQWQMGGVTLFLPKEHHRHYHLHVCPSLPRSTLSLEMTRHVTQKHLSSKPRSSISQSINNYFHKSRNEGLDLILIWKLPHKSCCSFHWCSFADLNSTNKHKHEYYFNQHVCLCSL